MSKGKRKDRHGLTGPVHCGQPAHDDSVTGGSVPPTQQTLVLLEPPSLTFSTPGQSVAFP